MNCRGSECKTWTSNYIKNDVYDIISTNGQLLKEVIEHDELRSHEAFSSP